MFEPSAPSGAGSEAIDGDDDLRAIYKQFDLTWG